MQPSAPAAGRAFGGSLAPLVQRSDQTDKQLADHERRLGHRLDALERSRRPLVGIGALTAVATVAVAARGLTAR